VTVKIKCAYIVAIYVIVLPFCSLFGIYNEISEVGV